MVDYDNVYDSMTGWFAYAKQANTYHVRRMMGEKLDQFFPNELSSIELRKIKNYLQTKFRRIVKHN